MTRVMHDPAIKLMYPLEKDVKAEIKRLLAKHGAYWFMPVQNGMGAPTLDFLVCHNGRFLAIEAKQPGKHPTPRQQITIKNIDRSSGDVMVYDGGYNYSGSETLEQWLLAYK